MEQYKDFTYFDNQDMDKVLAYFVGFVLPFHSIKQIKHDKYLICSVAYNKVEPVEEIGHMINILKFIYNEYNKYNFFILSNHIKDDLNKNLFTKQGFSFLFKVNFDNKLDYIDNVLLKRANEIEKSSNIEFKKFFISGVFDGRGSYDNKSKFAIDIKHDSDVYKTNTANIINNICASLDLKFNYNSKKYPANHQIRISLDKDIFNKIELFSIQRIRKIQENLIKY